MSIEKVIVALDKSPWEEIEQIVKDLRGLPCWMKVGMELYYAHGNKAVEFIASQGFNVFLDLKLHDIPTTVHNALLNLLKLPIHMVNVHAAGGPIMLEEAFDALVQSGRKDVKLIAVTQLTSTSEEMMQHSLGIKNSLESTVLAYAEMTKDSGLHGVVCSPLEVEKIKNLLGTPFLCVTPGIRLQDSLAHDQIRITTPDEAIKLGSDYIVVGRAITGSANPRMALENLFEGI